MPKPAPALLAILVALALAAPAGAGASGYRVGPLVRVSGASPHADGCNGAGSHATGAEGEPSLAVNPRNPRNIVVGFKQDVDNPDSSAVGVAVSRDAGKSWRQGTLPASGACNGGDSQYPYVTDPWVAFGPGNVVWFATLPYTTANPGAVAVHRSTDGGRRFGRPVYVVRHRDGVRCARKDSPPRMQPCPPTAWRYSDLRVSRSGPPGHGHPAASPDTFRL